MISSDKAFFCSNRACKFALWKNNRYFASIGKSMTSATAQKLLGSGKVKPVSYTHLDVYKRQV